MPCNHNGAMDASLTALRHEPGTDCVRVFAEIEHAVTEFAHAPNGGTILTIGLGGDHHNLIIGL